MRKVILLIKNWLNERRVQKVIKEAESQNLSPRTYKVWEHKEWGNRISIRHVNDNGTFNIDGHLTPQPCIGDYIVYECKSGKKGKGIVIKTEYPGDPIDMFFATVMPVEYYKQ